MDRCNFYVGQRVVCVRADNTHLWGVRELVEGRTYTVARIGPVTPAMAAHHPIPRSEIGTVVVYLEGVVRDSDAQLPHELRMGFYHTRFRPATDISALEALLKTAKPPAKPRQRETT